MIDRTRFWRRLSVGFVVGFGVTALIGTIGPTINGTVKALRAEYVPTVHPTVDHEIALVVIGSPECEFSTSQEVREAIRKLKTEVVATAAEAGADFRLIGVSVNGDPMEGVAFLKTLGQFDEITAGGFFRNSAAQEFLFGDAPGVAATPQVILLDRQGDPDGPSGMFSEVVLARLAGAPSILNAAAQGLVTRQILRGRSRAP